MANELNRKHDTVKRQLYKKGIEPEEFIGATGMYRRSAMEEIRIVPSVGRPKNNTEPQTAKPKAKKKPKK